MLFKIPKRLSGFEFLPDLLLVNIIYAMLIFFLGSVKSIEGLSKKKKAF